MNEKQFLKSLNSKKYGPNEVVYFSVLNLLQETEEKSIIPYKKSFFSKIFRKKQSKQKTAEQIVIDNFDLILSKWNCYGSNPQIIRELLKREEFKEILETNFHKIIEIINRDINQGNDTLNGFVQYNMWRLVMEFRIASPLWKSFIKDNIKQIIENTSVQELFKVVQLLKGENIETDEFLNQVLEENKANIARNLILASMENRGLNEIHVEQCAKDYALTLSIMIDELLQSEGKSWIDLNEKGHGTFSNVFEIGEKILKLGEPRKTYKIPYHRRILQPLVRTNFQTEGNDVVCVEISEKVDTRFECNETETIYQIYKELREAGIFWTDPKIDNIGRLRRDNVINLNGEILDVDSAAVGFEGEKKEEPLKVGDLVILDTDYIYKEGDPELFWGNKFDGPALERKYQQEKQEEIAKKYNEQRINVKTTKEKDEQQQL